MIEKKDLTTAQNARINISYKRKKPDIRFSYPSSKKINPEMYLMRNLILLSMYGTAIGYFIIFYYNEYYGLEIPGLLPMIVAFAINLIVLRFTIGFKLKKHIPELALGTALSCYSKRWRKVPKEKYLEIPLFDNVKMDYKATKEFAEYLTEIDIREHPFKYRKHNLFTGTKEEPQEHLWRCRFYFSKIPKKGYLEAMWI